MPNQADRTCPGTGTWFRRTSGETPTRYRAVQRQCSEHLLVRSMMDFSVPGRCRCGRDLQWTIPLSLAGDAGAVIAGTVMGVHMVLLVMISLLVLVAMAFIIGTAPTTPKPPPGERVLITLANLPLVGSAGVWPDLAETRGLSKPQ